MEFMYVFGSLIFLVILMFLLMRYWTTCSYVCAVKTSFRKLWVDHGIYTRLFIVSYLSNNSTDADSVSRRLMKNQEDIGNAVSQLCGKRKGDQLIVLLKTHIAGAARILKDLKTSSSFVDDDVKAWYQNGDEIAKYLAIVNSEWTYKNNLEMIKKHLDLTILEVQQYAKGQYAESIQTFDRAMDELMMMSDYLVNNS